MRQKRSPSCAARLRERLRLGKGFAQGAWRAFEVQMTSRKCRFIHVSQLTRLPLYVSPFFSSYGRVSRALLASPQGQKRTTSMGCPMAVFSSERGCRQDEVSLAERARQRRASHQHLGSVLQSRTQLHSVPTQLDEATQGNYF